MPTLAEQAHVAEPKDIDWPKWVTKEVKDIVGAAQMVGWMVHLVNGTIKIVSPDGRKTHVLSRREKVAKRHIMADVVRYGDRLKLELAKATLQMPDGQADATLQALHEATSTNVVVHDRTYVDVPDEVLDGTDAARQIEESESSTVEPEVVAVEGVATLKPTIVSENFMLVKSSDGDAYRSEHTIERKWSDGSTDYKCARCDYTAKGRKSVPSHQQVHVAAGEGRAGKPDKFKAEVPDAISYRPRQSRVNALAEFLLDRCTGSSLESVEEWRDLAREALNWQHEQSKQGTEFAAETEEMSAEDMLARIRRMVASDAITKYETEMSRMSHDLLILGQQCEAAQSRAEQAEAKAQRAQETLHSLIELAKESDVTESE